jgi:metal-responsive CopG/Arc/MetJ family transcriptional regulator
MGQPITVEGKKSVGIRLPGRLFDAIDARASAYEASRSEAIRRLVERALATEKRWSGP